MVRRETDKIQATTRLEIVWLDVCTKIGIAAQKREKKERANEKPKLDNARRLRGICFIDPANGKIKRSPLYCEEKVGTSNGCGNAVQERYKEALQLSGH